jgi:spore coat protein JB
MYTFALKDLNLYLDTHPSDDSMLKEFNKINNKLIELKREYENNYGPLCINSVNNDTYSWINNPWPWDKGGK